jgi:hypothetical protein
LKIFFILSSVDTRVDIVAVQSRRSRHQCQKFEVKRSNPTWVLFVQHFTLDMSQFQGLLTLPHSDLVTQDNCTAKILYNIYILYNTSFIVLETGLLVMLGPLEVSWRHFQHSTSSWTIRLQEIKVTLNRKNKIKKNFFFFASAEISHYKKMELTFFSPKLWNAWNHISKLWHCISLSDKHFFRDQKKLWKGGGMPSSS